MNYQSEKADSLETYVYWRFSLSATALHLYRGIRWLEHQQAGLCKKVRAGFREIAGISGIDIKSVRKTLLELQEKGLIELTIGSPIKADKKKTEFRRKTLNDLKIKSAQGDDEAHRLARVLTERAFYFEGKEIQPMWTVAHTGRVCSSGPNIQGVKGKDPVRVAGLKSGLKQGQALVHSDIKSADPAIIKDLLGIPRERDFYQQYMTATGCSKDIAKKKVNTLAYCRNPFACFRHWPESARSVLGDYVQSLTEYRNKLYAEFKKTRTVTTLTGRFIFAEKGYRTSEGKRIHAGKVFNWRVQGTVADIINAACLKLLDCAEVVIPLHDAIYAILPGEKAGEVESNILTKAHEIGLTVQVKTEVHNAC